jgi:hypothetical protein
MEDYYEQIIKCDNEKTLALIRLAIGCVTLLLIAVSYFLGVPTLFLAALAVLIIGLFVVLPQFNMEYEYLYISKELSVDRIYNKERRKKMGSYDLTNMEIMAPEGSDALWINKDAKSVVHDYTSQSKNGQVYVIIMKDKDSTRIRFEPDSDILRAIKSQFPRQARY